MKNLAIFPIILIILIGCTGNPDGSVHRTSGYYNGPYNFSGGKVTGQRLQEYWDNNDSTVKEMSIFTINVAGIPYENNEVQMREMGLGSAHVGDSILFYVKHKH